ncbi:aminoacyl-histidine dipeptidase [Leptotrichia sp. OH3620_COT-345]|uniref:aminoacyl-histidine dipeptidase n=1 Tax=Leptotrichia sp. OH3620_COT-345 TaxID=2491048 RepID=UPI000F64574E|nr:aminoacyl-histidine dipeptidase [Leptotrichia sp. OH3620_COT-345]RRD38950.1 aminoacyl-histidine dipeptidase [Leptotrichia sp. OH3620_COT-345]
MNVAELYPEKVFYYFSEISKIPRGSKKEKKISDWLVKFAKDRKLEVIQDEFLNVIIKKKATKGYEDFSPLILQGHMDMVWEKNKDTKFDFETQGIKLVVEDGFLKADGTTLGADDGIAVAYVLAILDSDDIKHPALEILITTDEEDGMTGASNLDYSIFQGKTLINLDTEEYGEIYVSSAGGGRTTTQFIFSPKKIKTENSVLISIEVKGLSGGHSGAEIHKNLGNSNKILGELLYHLSKGYSIRLIHIDGGEKVNVIPREASVKLNVNLDGSSLNEFRKAASLAFENILKDFKVIDESPILEVKEIKIEELGKKAAEISQSDTANIITYLHEFHNGVRDMSKEIEGLVETSTNLGVIKTERVGENVQIIFRALSRSSVNSSLQNVLTEITDSARKHGANLRVDTVYPSWEYKKDSRIRELIVKSFKEVTGKDAEIKAIHAGLECGYFADGINELDVVSIGPNIYGAHSPQEKMDIKSVGDTWDLLLKILEDYNIK